jgi:flagellin
MAIYVNTNVQSIFAQRALGGNTFNLQKSIEKLSTGYRINRASDDAAGLSISEKLTSQIRGLEKAEQNIGDGISMVQTAEGALSIVQDNVQRIRELVVQGLNGTNSANELDAIQREINARIGTIDDISTDTEFNGLALLDGSLGNNAVGVTATDFSLQTGSDNGQITQIDFDAFIIDITGADAQDGLNAGAAFDLDDLNVSTATGAVGPQSAPGTPAAATASPLTGLDTMLDNLSTMRSELGAIQNSLESKAEYLNIARENALASRSRIKDVDVAKESSAMVKSQILQQTSAAMLSQANQTPQLALNLLP